MGISLPGLEHKSTAWKLTRSWHHPMTNSWHPCGLAIVTQTKRSLSKLQYMVSTVPYNVDHINILSLILKLPRRVKNKKSLIFKQRSLPPLSPTSQSPRYKERKREKRHELTLCQTDLGWKTKGNSSKPLWARLMKISDFLITLHTQNNSGVCPELFSSGYSSEG